MKIKLLLSESTLSREEVLQSSMQSASNELYEVLRPSIQMLRGTCMLIFMLKTMRGTVWESCKCHEN